MVKKSKKKSKSKKKETKKQSVSSQKKSLQKQIDSAKKQLATAQKNAPSKPTASTSSLGTRNLSVGAKGEDVKALQRMVGVAADGIYGPKTAAAVKAFQSSKGLKSDGIVGPLTKAALGGGSNPSVDASPYMTGDPEQDELLSELSTYINDYLDAGYQINPDLNLDDDTIRSFLDQAKEELAPYYAQKVAEVKDQLERDLTTNETSYGNAVEDEKANYQSALGSNREAWAGEGLTFSGQRNLGEQTMQNTANRNLSTLGMNYGNQRTDLIKGAEKKLGTPGLNSTGVNLSSLYGTNANLGGESGGFTSGGALQGYTPGLYGMGEIPMERTAMEKSYQQQLVDERYRRASNNPPSVLSYQNLLH